MNAVVVSRYASALPMGAVTVGAIRVLRSGRPLRHRLATAPHRAGHVHSVFDRVVNLAWHDGGLVTLQGPGPLAAPFALELVSVSRLDRLMPGDPVWRVDKALEFGDATVDCGAAASADTEMPDAGHPPTGWTVLSTGLAGVPASALSSSFGLEGRADLAAGIARRRSDLLLSGARKLIGLGEGLTPAGDDCLVGALAVLHRHDRSWLIFQTEVLASLVRLAQHRTTAIAAEFVRHAVDGHYAETVIDVLTASDAARRSAVATLCRTGATSGADILCGMRLALDALATRTP